ncbi:MAG TPA: DNA methyltransferase, partial [Pirellulales bacterium]|nr:DNA methyltransferase [Pirellulales bacterium]
FLCEALENRIPSARQLVYADSRANPRGRLPDDTWVLRPQDLADCFTPAEDTWYFPRVAGTFKERAGFHGCQMPEQLLGRIVRMCSKAGDLVLDPFSGSATTLAVAKKLGRRWLGFDLSPEYVERGRSRLDAVCLGDSLEGAAEPTVSAPATPSERGTKGRLQSPRVENVAAVVDPLPARQLKAFHDGLLDSYRRAYRQYSLDRVVTDPELNSQFIDACRQLGLPGEPRTWNWTLFGMRKAGLLAELPTTERTEYTWEQCDPYLFASEIAWRQMIDQGCESLDSIFCDPALAEKFDAVARRWAAGYSSLEYRWAALKLRKSAKQVRTRAKMLTAASLGKAIDLGGSESRQVPESAGVYVVLGSSGEALYAGEATNLRDRLLKQCGSKAKSLWKPWSEGLSVRVAPIACPYSTRLAHQRKLILRHAPRLNLPDQKMA